MATKKKARKGGSKSSKSGSKGKGKAKAKAGSKKMKSRKISFRAKKGLEGTPVTSGGEGG